MSGFDIPDDDEPYRPSPPITPYRNGDGGVGVGRTLPHSLEAEEYLLSCILLDGRDVLAQCLEMFISPEDFYDPKHGVIYDKMLELFDKQSPIDVSVVAEELKKSRQLDMVGGYAFLTQVSSRIPTTAQASYFIDRVKEQALLREMIRSATGVVEDAYGFSGEIDQYISKSMQRLESIATGATGALQKLNQCKFNPKKPIQKGRVAFRLVEIAMATAGNLVVLVAPPGVGKSALIGAVIASAFVKATDEVDTLGFSGPNYEGLPLLHFDTEQSEGDYQEHQHRTLRRAKLDKFPDWYHSYHLTGKSAGECRHLVETAISYHARKSKGKLFAVIIDGWADLVVDPNDTGECFPFVARMHMMSIKYDYPGIGVLHLNPGSEQKSRGHLGSQLERKAETVLQLEMDADRVTAVWASKKRGVPISKDKGPRFKWSDNDQMHSTLGNWREIQVQAREQKKLEKEQKRPTAYREQFDRIAALAYFPPSSEDVQPRQQIIRRMNDTLKVNDRMFSRLAQQFLDERWTEKSESGYRRTREGDDWVKRGKEGPPPAAKLDDEEFPL